MHTKVISKLITAPAFNNAKRIDDSYEPKVVNKFYRNIIRENSEIVFSCSFFSQLGLWKNNNAVDYKTKMKNIVLLFLAATRKVRYCF